MKSQERFDAVNKEYRIFDLVKNKRSSRPDLHAFMLLDSLFPGSHDVVSASEHDVIYLFPSEDKIESLTDEQILELTRCGVMYDDDSDSLMMFT
jgi:hypothetical protein